MRIPAATVVLAALALPAGSVAAVPEKVAVRGRVTDEGGRGVAEVPVRLLQSRRDFLLLEWTFEDRVKDELVARTDQHGFFEAEVVLDPEYRSYWVRFYEPSDFDAVRYQVPEDRDITQRARNGRPVFESIVLKDHPDWKAVRWLIEQLGPGTARAKVVRQMGIPDRRDELEGTERFWYEEQGMVYRFRDGEFIGQRPWVPAENDAGSSKGS